MRKNKMMRAASGLLVATLLTTSVISGTFAKYTSSASGKDTARVAKWEITYKDNSTNGGDAVNLVGSPTNLKVSLFDYTDGNVDVVGKDGKKIVAPGTAGSFSFTIESKSEVSANTVVTLKETNTSNIPIEYGLKSADTDAPTTWVKADDQGIINLSLNHDFTANAATSTANIK